MLITCIVFLLFLNLHVAPQLVSMDLFNYLWGRPAPLALQPPAAQHQVSPDILAVEKPQAQEAQRKRPELDQILEKIPQNNTAPIYVNLNIQDISNQKNQDITVMGFNPFDRKSYKDFATKSKDKAVFHFISIREWLQNNKKKAAWYALAGFYISVQTYLLYLVKKLAHPDCWSRWKANTKLEELYKIPQAQLAKELLNEIQRSYTSVNNPTDFVTPLTTFMHETDYEDILLRRYKKLVIRLRSCHIHPFFYYDIKLFNTIDDRIQKLSYMKNSFLAWLADYKLNHPYQMVHKRLVEQNIIKLPESNS